MDLGRSLIHKNSRGRPRTVPCGTPDKTALSRVTSLPTHQDFLCPVSYIERKSEIRSKTGSLIPYYYDANL